MANAMWNGQDWNDLFPDTVYLGNGKWDSKGNYFIIHEIEQSYPTDSIRWGLQAPDGTTFIVDTVEDDSDDNNIT